MPPKKKTNILSLEQIRQAADVTEETIPVPEWKGDVVIRSITKRQMKEIKNKAKDAEGEIDEDEVEKLVFVAGMVEPTVTEEDYEWMLDKSASAMSRVTKAILGNSNMGADKVKQEEKQFRSR